MDAKKSKFNNWLYVCFIKYNPLYFLSTLFVLLGVYLISKGLSGGVNWISNQVILSGVFQVYEVLIIGGLYLLFRFSKVKRPAYILACLETFIMLDASFRNEMFANIEKWGLYLSFFWFVLIIFKVFFLLKVFKIKFSFSTLSLPVVFSSIISFFPHLYLNHDIIRFSPYKEYFQLILLTVGIVLVVVSYKVFVPRIKINLFKLIFLFFSAFYFLHVISWFSIFLIKFKAYHLAPVFLIFLFYPQELAKWLGFGLFILFSLSEPLITPWVSIIVGITLITFSVFSSQKRLYAAATLAIYFGVYTFGWSGGNFPEPNVWINCIFSCLLFFIGYHYKIISPSIGVFILIYPIVPDIKKLKSYLPSSKVILGILSLISGFIMLIAGFIINWYQRQNDFKVLKKEEIKEDIEVFEDSNEEESKSTFGTFLVVFFIVGFFILIGLPGYLTKSRCHRGYRSREMANLKAVTDNIASYNINERKEIDSIIRLWPSTSNKADPSSYVRKQLFCPRDKCRYYIKRKKAYCYNHGSIEQVRRKDRI